MRWAIGAVALVVAANGFILMSARADELAPATHVGIDICPQDLIGTSDAPVALRIGPSMDTTVVPVGLDSASLVGLGFDATAVRSGRRPPGVSDPRPRPAWVRLRQRPAPQTARPKAAQFGSSRFEVVQVAARPDLMARDSTSIIVRGRVGWQARTGTQPVGVVLQVLPDQLHLDRSQRADLHKAFVGLIGCAVAKPAVLTNWMTGAIRIEAVR